MPQTQSSRSNKILEVEDLHVRYGQVHAVRGIGLQLAAGQALALLGPNGSGKSSTISAITGLIRADSGRICIDGIDLAADAHACRARLGVVPQEFAFYEEMTARDNLLFVGRLYGLHGTRLRSRVHEALDFVSLGDVAGRRANKLSGGMQRRLNLACALLHRPVLLLLDEPTVGLDIASRDAIYRLLDTLAGQGCAIVLTTHHLHEAESFCDTVALMNQGTIIAQGTMDELSRLSLSAKPTKPRPPGESSVMLGVSEGHKLRGPHSKQHDLERIYTRLLGATSPQASAAKTEELP